MSICSGVLGIKGILVKFVLKLLNFDQNNHRAFLWNCYSTSVTIQICSKVSQLVVKYEYMVTTSKPKEEPRPKKHTKFGQRWSFYPLFSSITMAWHIVGSCQNLVLNKALSHIKSVYRRIICTCMMIF